MKLKPVAVPVGLALWVAFFAVAAPAQDLLEISDHGRFQRFETARDEMFTTTPDGKRRLEKTSARATFADVRRETDRVRQTRGGDAQIVLYEANRPHSEATRRLLTRRTLVVLDPGTDAAALAAQAGAVSISPAPALTNAWIFLASDAGGALDIADALHARRGVIHAEPLLARQQFKRMVPNDPFFTNQWHLLNTGQNGGTAGVDVSVTNVWSTYRGDGIRIGIVDDGLQYTHPDLTNCDRATSHDFADDDADPAPNIANEDFHGTSCAGVAAGLGSNALGVAGAAYRARTVGLRLISYPTTDEQEAEAMSYSNDLIFIKSNSWGPYDDGRTLQGPGLLTLAAIEQAVATGRNGLGTIFVWAGGNGDTNDNSNKDGYANLIQTIAICAVNDRGQRAWYSEPGANLVVATPSGDSGAGAGSQDITTTDLVGNNGYNVVGSPGEYSNRDYTKTFGGTSSSCPLAAGVIALILQANPGLGWRDVQEILIRSATKNHSADTDWTNNPAGIHFNHQYGAGLVSASNAVKQALTWTNLSQQTWLTIQRTNLNVSIPDNTAGGVTQRFDLSSTGIRVEHVRVEIDIDHARRGDLEITLISPSGMRSTLIPNITWDILPDYKHWPLMSVRHWGESSAGTWSLKVADRRSGTTGTWLGATLTVYGTAIGATAPSPVFVSSSTDDSDGNGNGALDPGEIISERAVLRNVGATATNVTLSLSTTNAQVFMIQSNATIALLTPPVATTNTPPFSYRLSKALPCGTVLTFNLVAAYTGGAITTLIDHTVGTTYTYGFATSTNGSVDIPKIIPDLGSVFSTTTVAVAGSPIIDDINVKIRINHTFDADLQIAARHPDGTEIYLSNRNGGSGNNYGSGSSCGSATYTIFDDEAATSIILGSAPFSGTFRPESSLATFDGKPLNGTWKLRTSDLEAGDTGTNLCWSLVAAYHYESTICNLFNNPPTASNVSVTTTSPAPALIQLVGNDVDVEPITFITNAPPPGGTLSNFNPTTGSILYTPAVGFCGTDTFAFAVSDGSATSAPATVTVVVTCAPNPDSDGDGMDDEWELRFFDSLTNANASTDADADGFLDLHEFLEGSIPTNAASLLAATVVSNGVTGGLVIQWQSHSNRNYILGRADDLIVGFTGIASNLISTPPLNIYTDAVPTNAARFYRIQLQ